jgi:hypothetical protein
MAAPFLYDPRGPGFGAAAGLQSKDIPIMAVTNLIL